MIGILIVTFSVKKVLELKLFGDEPSNGQHWARNVTQGHLEILLISQFTLHAKTCKGIFNLFTQLLGTKLDFHSAMTTEQSRVEFLKLVELFKSTYSPDKIQSNNLL